MKRFLVPKNVRNYSSLIPQITWQNSIKIAICVKSVIAWVPTIIIVIILVSVSDVKYSWCKICTSYCHVMQILYSEGIAPRTDTKLSFIRFFKSVIRIFEKCWRPALKFLIPCNQVKYRIWNLPQIRTKTKDSKVKVQRYDCHHFELFNKSFYVVVGSFPC